MKKNPAEILREGCTVLDPLLRSNGFAFRWGGAGRTSGGPSACGFYEDGNRKLEIHFRFSLGLVTYHFEGISVDHEGYMRAVLGNAGGNRYPGFSDNPLSGFKDLAYDLENFANAFVNGDFKEFARCTAAAEEWRKIPGFERLP